MFSFPILGWEKAPMIQICKLGKDVVDPRIEQKQTKVYEMVQL